MTRILEQGLVLSEHPPEVTPRAYHFPRRNRILAALATRVVVVEAAERSGALITAGIAADLGREVWAVPGSVFADGSRGTHALLRDGATPVPSIEAWAESLEPDLFTHAGGGRPDSPLPPGLGDGLCAHIWSVLGGEPRTLEEIAEAAGVDPREILPPLAALELGGWVRRGPGPSFFRAAS
jgi:DNA processing protein